MLKRFLKKKAKSDRGASSLISFILLVPLFLGLVITAVDLSFYFSNRGQVEAVARDAARTVAIFGGNGTAGIGSGSMTTIEASYGTKTIDACSDSRPDIANAPNKYIFTDVSNKQSTKTAVECNVLAALANNNGLVSFSTQDPVDVQCGPGVAASVGARTYCTIKYTYDGMPGAPMSFVQIRNDDGSVSGLLGSNAVTKSSESEVQYPNTVARG